MGIPGARFLSLISALLAMGCGDSEHREPGGAPDATSPGAALGPVGEGTGVRVFSGTAGLILDGPSCTGEEGAEGDRWCGFVALASDGNRDLYVFNVSAVRAGVAVTCDEPDPNCLLLTHGLVSSGANWHGNFFTGDTLVYYDETITPRAWRPGMETGRVLAERPPAADVIFCAPASRGTAVTCLSLPDVQEDATLIAATLYAGAADGDSEPLLQPLDSVILGRYADFGDAQRFSYGFPANGYVAWTTRESSEGPEVLKLAHTSDLSNVTTVASDVHGWYVSSDESRWYWQSGISEIGTGLLQTATFPDGAEVTDVFPNVRHYELDANDAVVALTIDGELVSIPDAAGAPEAFRLIDEHVQGLGRLSDQGSHVAYGKHFRTKELSDLFVSRLDATQACTLDTTSGVPRRSVHFSARGEGAVWSLAKGNAYDGFYTRLSDCSSVPVAPGVLLMTWVGEDTLVYTDDVNIDDQTGTLRYKKLAKKGTLDAAAPVLIAENVFTTTALGSTLLYTVTESGDADRDGVYVRAFAR
jgi:hypothetical protein